MTHMQAWLLWQISAISQRQLRSKVTASYFYGASFIALISLDLSRAPHLGHEGDPCFLQASAPWHKCPAGGTRPAVVLAYNGTRCHC